MATPNTGHRSQSRCVRTAAVHFSHRYCQFVFHYVCVDVSESQKLKLKEQKCACGGSCGEWIWRRVAPCNLLWFTLKFIQLIFKRRKVCSCCCVTCSRRAPACRPGLAPITVRRYRLCLCLCHRHRCHRHPNDFFSSSPFFTVNMKMKYFRAFYGTCDNFVSHIHKQRTGKNRANGDVRYTEEPNSSCDPFWIKSNPLNMQIVKCFSTSTATYCAPISLRCTLTNTHTHGERCVVYVWTIYVFLWNWTVTSSNIFWISIFSFFPLFSRPEFIRSVQTFNFTKNWVQLYVWAPTLRHTQRPWRTWERQSE